MEAASKTVWRVARLAAPVALAELGWMSMSVVDTIMVGSLGPAAIGAIGVGNGAFYCFAICGMGMLFGLDTLVSQAWGARNREDCHHSLVQGIYLALLVGAPLMILFSFMPPVFSALGIVPDVARPAAHFLTVLSYSTWPLLLYAALRRYLQGMGHVRPVMFALISANVVNWFFNWLLIRGHWGFPALGVVGSALSTGLARLYMASCLAFAVWWLERGPQPVFRRLLRQPDWQRIQKLLKIGAPAAGQILLEIGAFSAVGVLAGRLNANALAAHQIALQCAALSFMVPLGISSAAAVSVGHAIGAGSPVLARRSGFTSIVIACTFMAGAALAFIFAPHAILGIFTRDRDVIATGTGLLVLAAGFQLFDGIQTVATGALRGMGETRIPMYANLIGYWVLGLPVGYLLCFHYGQGVFGLWWGLTIALILISLVLLHTWQVKSRHISRFAMPVPQPTP